MSGTASPTCEPCEAGKFNNEAESDSCSVCPANERSDEGSTSCTCIDSFVRDPDNSLCVCPAGTTGVGTLCEPCPIGTYKDKLGNVACETCEAVVTGSTTVLISNSTLATSEVQCVCEAGYFKYPADEESPTEGLPYCAKIDSLKVPEGVDSTTAGVNVTNLPVLPSFWRTTRTSTDVRHCFSPEACLGGPDPEQSCAEGHTGAYCGVCEEGYSAVGSSLSGMTCVECTGDSSSSVKMGIGVISLLLLASIVYMYCKRRRGAASSAADALAEANNDVKAILAKKKQLEKKRKAADKFLNNVQTPFKIILSYVQIVSGFSFNFSIRFPPLFSTVMSFCESERASEARATKGCPSAARKTFRTQPPDCCATPNP